MFNEQKSTEYHNLNTLKLSEVGERINLKKGNAIKKWLDSQNIKISKIGKILCVYEIDVDFALNKPFVTSLKNKHPDNWKHIFKTVCRNTFVYDYTISILEGEHEYKPITKVLAKSLNDKKLLKRLTL